MDLFEDPKDPYEMWTIILIYYLKENCEIYDKLFIFIYWLLIYSINNCILNYIIYLV